MGWEMRAHRMTRLEIRIRETVEVWARGTQSAKDNTKPRQGVNLILIQYDWLCEGRCPLSDRLVPASKTCQEHDVMKHDRMIK
jgi:hypothetical protein